jgi:hypothetical protein
MPARWPRARAASSSTSRTRWRPSARARRATLSRHRSARCRPRSARACWCASTRPARRGTPTTARRPAHWPRNGWIAGVVLPKAERAADLARIAQAIGPSGVLVPLVESVAGLDAADELAGAPQVLRLAFGNLDFQADLGLACDGGEAELAPLRLALLMASRRAGLPAPIDGVTPDWRDAARLAADAARARRGGFGAKAVHPPRPGGAGACRAGARMPASWRGRAAWSMPFALRAAAWRALTGAWSMHPSCGWPNAFWRSARRHRPERMRIPGYPRPETAKHNQKETKR